MDLLQEYEVSREIVRQKLRLEADENDVKILKAMLRDLNYVIRWLEAGHEPHPIKAIYNTKQEILFDTATLELAFSERVASPFIKGAPDEEEPYRSEQRIAEALAHLKPRDKEIYIMHYAGLKSCSQIAALTGINSEAVKKVLQRSRKKIAKGLAECSTFSSPKEEQSA